LAVGAICFSWIMALDIWSFAEMMRKRYDALWKKEKDDVRCVPMQDGSSLS